MKIAGAVGLIALSLTGVGAVAGGALAFALGATSSAVISAAGSLLAATALTLGTTSLAKSVGLGPKSPKGVGGIRGRVDLDPNAPQWIVVGQTATKSQLIYFGTSGTNNDQLSMIFCHAACVTSGFVALEINNIATAFPTPSGAYAGILAIETADGTQTSNPFTSVHGGLWGSTDIGQGLTLSHFRWSYDKTKLASGLPQQIRFEVKGIAVYDPRKDSTRGGSGSQRADDETTWAWTASGYDQGRNPALIELSYRLGWKKNGRLFAGMGEDPANFDYASYIAAANVCDEVVNGKPRYRCDGLLSIGPDAVHNDNLAAIHASCGGKPVDTGGRIGLWVAHDDTASAVATFGPDDWLGDITWEPLPQGLRNTARGKFVDTGAYYEAADYPEVAPSDLLALDNGEELADSLDFALVQDVDQARRLANIRLRESRQGVFTAPAALKAIARSPAEVIAIDHPRLGWSAKKFRVETMGLEATRVQMVLRAVASADYADIANTTVTPPGDLPTIGYVPVPGTTPANTVPVIIGTSSTIELLVPDGATAYVTCTMDSGATAGAGTRTVTLDSEKRNAGSWTGVGSDSDTDTVPAGYGLSAGGSYTNTTGAAELVGFRAIGAISSGDTTTPDPATSFLSVSLS